MTTSIIIGADYNQFMADLRAIVRHECTQVLATQTAHIADVGGLALAKEITGLSESRIYALVSARQIPHSKRGNKLYFNRADLLAWVKVGDRIEKKVAYA
jgi:predicted DNA-binding transcriptional regulator AlpA